jgi:mevalonate kinase
MNNAAAPVPAQTLPVAARAPGKCILFGEHAVVHGRPELVLAIDLFTQVGVRSAAATRLNGNSDAFAQNDYFRAALERLWPDGPPIDVTAVSRIPRAAGLGSSAAFVAALTSALGAATGGITRAQLAETSFGIERTAQGVGSPGDTSAVVGGGYLAINGGSGESLWTIREGGAEWTVRRIPDPGWVWLVAYSGVPRSTGEAVRAVGRRLEAADGPEVLRQFAAVAEAGIRAVLQEDRAEIGPLLEQNQQLLREVGVSHPRLEALLKAAAPSSEGGKLTGAGAGGSIVVLPRPGREMETARQIARVGGVPYVVRVATEGARLVESPR